MLCEMIAESRLRNFSEEEEVDKMMEQKLKEEEERKRTKEIEERMSLEETKEQVGTILTDSFKPFFFFKLSSFRKERVAKYNLIKLLPKYQVMKMGEKLQGLQEEKHQLFLQLKKVLHEEEKRRRKEQRYFH